MNGVQAQQVLGEGALQVLQRVSSQNDVPVVTPPIGEGCGIEQHGRDIGHPLGVGVVRQRHTVEVIQGVAPLVGQEPRHHGVVERQGGDAENDHPIGVWYDGGANKWAVFNQDLAAMPVGADFNVLIPPTGADAFVHTATAANIAGHYTYIDHPLTNENPNAIVLVTQNWNPGGGSGTYNDHPIGVSI